MLLAQHEYVRSERVDFHHIRFSVAVQEQHAGALSTERDAAQQRVRSLTQELSEAQRQRDAARAELTAGSSRQAR